MGALVNGQGFHEEIVRFKGMPDGESDEAEVTEPSGDAGVMLTTLSKARPVGS